MTNSQWANIVLKMTATTAVIVIAGFLVYKLSGGLEKVVDKMETLSSQHMELVSKYQSSDGMTRRMLVVLRVMCVNAAKTEDARQSCLQENIP